MRDFWINIAAGIALAAASQLLFHVLAPWYLAWRYKAPKLAGHWVFFDSTESNAESVGTAEFSQSGESVTATTARAKSRSGRPIARSFKYRGRVRDGQVLLTFDQPDSNGFIAGNLVLKISGDLKTLTGFTVYLDRDAGNVVAHPISFRRA